MKNFRLSAPNIVQPIFKDSPAFFKPKPLVLKDKATFWRELADSYKLSADARLRLEWMIFHYFVSDENAYATANHFGIVPKTFYKWFNRFDKNRVDKLESVSRAPHNTRKPEITFLEECRIKKLRKAHLRYGKKKIKRLYIKEYNEDISTWKVETTIRKFNLFPSQIEAEKARERRKKQLKKERIQKLDIKEEHWFLFHLDTITIYLDNTKRYILTAIDHHGKVAYARAYKNKSSRSAKDFLYRLHYLINVDLANIQTDNGSEFFHQFEEALNDLKIKHWFSRPRTPQDNAIVERFNQTLQGEWLNDGHLTADVNKQNRWITDWLEEYNFQRPHQTLDYLTPFEYLEETLAKQQKLLPMYSASTGTVQVQIHRGHSAIKNAMMMA